MTTDYDKPVPLPHLITGTLTMHFPGAIVKRRMSLAEAQSAHQAQTDERASDRLVWHALAWFQWSSDKVVASTFDADEDLGFGLTPEERDTLATNGHPHGVLRTLRDQWQDSVREPSYSATAIHHLHQAALDGISTEEFTRLAVRIEGNVGARRLRDVLDRLAANDADQHGRPTVDDATVPEDSSGESETELRNSPGQASADEPASTPTDAPQHPEDE